METKEYDAVVFDMDGVIFDSERAVMNCWLEIADKYGKEVNYNNELRSILKEIDDLEASINMQKEQINIKTNNSIKHF